MNEWISRTTEQIINLNSCLRVFFFCFCWELMRMGELRKIKPKNNNKQQTKNNYVPFIHHSFEVLMKWYRIHLEKFCFFLKYSKYSSFNGYMRCCKKKIPKNCINIKKTFLSLLQHSREFFLFHHHHFFLAHFQSNFNEFYFDFHNFKLLFTIYSLEYSFFLFWLIMIWNKKKTGWNFQQNFLMIFIYEFYLFIEIEFFFFLDLSNDVWWQLCVVFFSIRFIVWKKFFSFFVLFC